MQSQPSRTALAVALRRAAHQMFDTPLVFADALAVAIIGPAMADRIRAEPGAHRERFSVALRAFVVARAQATEEALTRAVSLGVTQFVVLGAGLDTFGCRNPHESLRVFEVDHPATQEWKRGLIADAGITPPPTLTFAPVDFERETLAAGLAHAGFDATAPALFSWLGVTMYLTEDAFASTLAFIASRPAGSGVVFDYAVESASLRWKDKLALVALSRRVARAGEPFRTFFSPAGLRARLEQAGFQAIEDLGADDLNARYFADRADGLRVSGGLGRLVSATRV